MPTTTLDALSCPTLPSSESAQDLIDGKPGALPRVVAHTALRAGLVAVGMYAVGIRGRDLAFGALGGAIGIEMFVFGYRAYQSRTKR
jgi:hypothetical protein